jgi:hypothetical protein
MCSTSLPRVDRETDTLSGGNAWWTAVRGAAICHERARPGGARPIMPALPPETTEPPEPVRGARRPRRRRMSMRQTARTAGP